MYFKQIVLSLTVSMLAGCGTSGQSGLTQEIMKKTLETYLGLHPMDASTELHLRPGTTIPAMVACGKQQGWWTDGAATPFEDPADLYFRHNNSVPNLRRTGKFRDLFLDDYLLITKEANSEDPRTNLGGNNVWEVHVPGPILKKDPAEKPELRRENGVAIELSPVYMAKSANIYQRVKFKEALAACGLIPAKEGFSREKTFEQIEIQVQFFRVVENSVKGAWGVLPRTVDSAELREMPLK